MREMPVRPLPLPSPPAQIEVKPSDAPKINGGAAVAEIPELQPRKAPDPEYVFHIKFAHTKTGEERTEMVQFGSDEIAEASLDGLGATGPRGREIAIRIAQARVEDQFIFKSASFDLGRLEQSLNRD